MGVDVEVRLEDVDEATFDDKGEVTVVVSLARSFETILGRFRD